MTRIRIAVRQDRDAVRDVHLRAFPRGENALVARLAVDLLEVASRPDTIALVAACGEDVVGHVAFSPVRADADAEWLGYLLAPLGVKPEHQRRRVGTMLVERGIEKISGTGADVLLVYGDPDYYRQFGFRAETASRYRPPYALQYPSGWQAVLLHEGSARDEAVALSCVAPLGDPALW